MPQSVPHDRPLSAVLSEIAEGPDARVSIAELTQSFGGRAIGALLFVFGLACLLPFPPGATTIFGLPLVLLAPQLIVGASAPWLPRRVKARTVSTADLRASLPRILPWLRRAEAISRPRLSLLFGGVGGLGERIIGLVCFILGLVLILPIPGANLLPALAVSSLSFALIQRDGLIAVFGYLIAAASASVLVLAAHIVVRTFQHMLSLVGAA